MFVPGPYMQAVLTYVVAGWPPAYSILNFWHFDFANFQDEAEGVSLRIEQCFIDHWRAVMYNGCVLANITITDMREPNGAQFTREPNIVGTGVGEALPQGTAGLIKWSAGFAGRAYHGRTYFPGAREADNGGAGTPGGTYKNVLGQGAGQLHALPPENEGSLVVVSKRAGGQWRQEALVTGVTGHSVGDYWARQKRRGRAVFS